MYQFNNLNNEVKIVFFLELSELIMNEISTSEGYNMVTNSLEKCWQWLKLKNIEADDLYLYLENIDETGLLSYIPSESDSYKKKIWICIANALAYIILIAYQYEKIKYLPQTIESVDNETVNIFIKNFKEVYKNPEIVDCFLNYLLKQYSIEKKNDIDFEEIKKFILKYHD